MRRKRTSEVLEIARQKLAGLRQIQPKPNFGPVMSEEAYAAEIEAFGNELDSYNGDIAAVDDKSNRLDGLEQRLADFNQRITSAIRMQFGPDSSELELVGVVRRSDRKRPVTSRKPPVPA